MIPTWRILLFAMSLTSSVLEVARKPEFSTSSTLSCTYTHRMKTRNVWSEVMHSHGASLVADSRCNNTAHRTKETGDGVAAENFTGTPRPLSNIPDLCSADKYLPCRPLTKLTSRTMVALVKLNTMYRS